MWGLGAGAGFAGKWSQYQGWQRSRSIWRCSWARDVTLGPGPGVGLRDPWRVLSNLWFSVILCFSRTNHCKDKDCDKTQVESGRTTAKQSLCSFRRLHYNLGVLMFKDKSLTYGPLPPLPPPGLCRQRRLSPEPSQHGRVGWPALCRRAPPRPSPRPAALPGAAGSSVQGRSGALGWARCSLSRSRGRG